MMIHKFNPRRKITEEEMDRCNRGERPTICEMWVPSGKIEYRDMSLVNCDDCLDSYIIGECHYCSKPTYLNSGDIYLYRSADNSYCSYQCEVKHRPINYKLKCEICNSTYYSHIKEYKRCDSTPKTRTIGGRSIQEVNCEHFNLEEVHDINCIHCGVIFHTMNGRNDQFCSIKCERDLANINRIAKNKRDYIPLEYSREDILSVLSSYVEHTYTLSCKSKGVSLGVKLNGSPVRLRDFQYSVLRELRVQHDH